MLTINQTQQSKLEKYKSKTKHSGLIWESFKKVKGTVLYISQL